MRLDLELVAKMAMAGVGPQAFLIRSGTKYASCAWWNAAIGNLNSLVSYVPRKDGKSDTNDFISTHSDHPIEIDGLITMIVYLSVTEWMNRRSILCQKNLP